MAWQSRGIANSKKEKQWANYPNIRIFTVVKRGTNSPQDNCEGKWEPYTPETMSRSSAVAYFFSRRLCEILQVPVGLMVLAWGGMPAEAGKLYNQMIYPLVPFKIAGTIWYQGESNQDHYSSYNTLMKELINSWRKDFGYEFPFLFRLHHILTKLPTLILPFFESNKREPCTRLPIQE